jgi:glycosyltransferase involved in cell wall biosynthesis
MELTRFQGRNADILMLDRSLEFGPRTPEEQPLGGAESAFAWLAQALAARGHRVHVRTPRGRPICDAMIDWGPFEQRTPETVDMVIANRRWILFRHGPRKTRRVLWLHNVASGLGRLSWRAALAWYRPILVTASTYHQSTIPAGLFGATSTIIPMAPAALFTKSVEHAAAPKPHAVFTSNPARGLDRLLQLWATRIRPAVSHAMLHVFGGAETYQRGLGRATSEALARTLVAARQLEGAGVIVHAPMSRPLLSEHLARARAMLYPGSPEETYCLAVAEAQAMGVPAVLGNVGCLSERIVHNATGFLADGDDAFVAHAIQVLSDDTLWLSMHRQCLARRHLRTWDHVAADFEELLMPPPVQGRSENKGTSTAMTPHERERQ